MSDEAAADVNAQVLRQLLVPLARLALGQGVTHAQLDELLKQALVEQAYQALDGLPPHRRISRISTTTGIHRREVTRLVALLQAGEAAAAAALPQRSLAAELFTRWRSEPACCDLMGSPRELPRQGPAPSFEALAQGVTRDVHPRSLLDELIRLGLAAHDAQRDTVRLLREGFVPHADRSAMLQTLGRTVGDHLHAAVDNLLLDHHRHFEQSLFAHGIVATELPAFKRLLEQQWQQMLGVLVPALQAAVDRSWTDGVPVGPLHRLRLGLYARDVAQPPAPGQGPGAAAGAPAGPPADPPADPPAESAADSPAESPADSPAEAPGAPAARIPRRRARRPDSSPAQS